MQEELVSIITPLYNGERFVAQTIESVLAQTYKNWEMLIVNDGSKDNGPEIVEEYAKKDGRIRLINQENGGSANARNHGIREAKGRYIALLDSDDVWEPTLLEEQLKFMKEKKTGLVFASYNRIDENSKPILNTLKCKPVVTEKMMLVRNYVGAPLTAIYDSNVGGKIYLHEELRSIRDDYAYFIDVMKAVKIGYGNNKALAKYRIFPNSTTGNKRKLIKLQYRFYRDYLHLPVIRSLYNTIVWGVAGFFNFGASLKLLKK